MIFVDTSSTLNVYILFFSGEMKQTVAFSHPADTEQNYNSFGAAIFFALYFGHD